MIEPRLSLITIVLFACLAFSANPVRSSDRTQEGRSNSRLVTGDPANLSSIASETAAAGLTFYFTPRPALPGTDPSLPYPAGSSISGQVLTAPQGGFTSAWIVQLEGWDSDHDGNPLLRA